MSEKEQINYDASKITVLEGLEAVRQTPGMYIGTTGIDGLYHLIWEVFDNSRDEAMGNYADTIEVVLLPNNTIRVADNGRGIPIDIHQKTKVSALETIMTTLHAGGKFGGDGYKVSGGLHGVGVSVVNALSTKVVATVHKDKHIYKQEYLIGKPVSKVKEIGRTESNGTAIMFTPDNKIFKEFDFSNEIYESNKIITHLRNQAFLVNGLKIHIIDARTVDTNKLDLENELFIEKQLLNEYKYSFYFPTGGLAAFIRYHNKSQLPVHSQIFYVEKSIGDINVFTAFQYVNDISSRIFAFGNNIKNEDGGTHITGFKTALTRSINSYAKEKKLFKGSESFTGDDVLEGLTAVISVYLPDIQFEGQTKTKLGSPEAKSAVEQVVGKELSNFLEENPTTAKQILTKIALAYEARKAARQAKDLILRKNVLDSSPLPGKLTDCQSRDLNETELFIVEGESAGGTAKQGRDRRTQAILPLKGKILNVERTRIDRIQQSEEIKTIILTLGTGMGALFNIEKLRYGKIIIATDADVDGAHIRTLLLTLFYRYFNPLIKNGNIFFAQPPLFKVKKGKKFEYAFSVEEKDKIAKSFSAKEDLSDIFIQRYKGLGEMNAEELWETTMNKENRILKQVVIEDAEAADETFDILMGVNVAPRKEFIQSNARYANLDV